MQKLVKIEWLTTGVIAAYCGVSRTTVLRWIKKGCLKAYTTPGGHRRVREDDFRQFLVAAHLPIDEKFFDGAAP